ncbi:MAG: PrgI family protein, partial [Candidatus Pacebacteria bacterium]|nr:PrgI family protein [Candidatus Paceibacterota bacterium]
MQYRVPQFIEHEAKILGPLNIRQSLMVGGVLAVCFFLYFMIGQTNFFLFLLIAGALTGIALAVSFAKIEGLSLPAVMKNWANFNINPRIYLWRRKQSPVYLSTQRAKREIVIREE